MLRSNFNLFKFCHAGKFVDKKTVEFEIRNLNRIQNWKQFCARFSRCLFLNVFYYPNYQLVRMSGKRSLQSHPVDNLNGIKKPRQDFDEFKAPPSKPGNFVLRNCVIKQV